MKSPIRILLQTTIPGIEDDWSIGRFSLLKGYLESLHDSDGNPLCQVTARDRENGPGGHDPVLRDIDCSDFDQLWLFAVDAGDGLTSEECEAITMFNRNGGGLLTSRDHHDLGSSLSTIGGVGPAHHFHSLNPESDTARHVRDDPYTTHISWPNYHSGANGDYQEVIAVEPAHDLLGNPEAPDGRITFLPAHPHEGAVALPPGEEHAAVIATGRSRITGQTFNLLVAFDRAETGNRRGRAVADSSFHHFVDYNWDPRLGAPSFVSEPPGDGMLREPRALSDTRAYIRNLALWLAPEGRIG